MKSKYVYRIIDKAGVIHTNNDGVLVAASKESMARKILQANYPKGTIQYLKVTITNKVCRWGNYNPRQKEKRVSYERYEKYGWVR